MADNYATAVLYKADIEREFITEPLEWMPKIIF